jgi:hypothetical protein
MVCNGGSIGATVSLQGYSWPVAYSLVPVVFTNLHDGGAEPKRRDVEADPRLRPVRQASTRRSSLQPLVHTEQTAYQL